MPGCEIKQVDVRAAADEQPLRAEGKRRDGRACRQGVQRLRAVWQPDGDVAALSASREEAAVRAPSRPGKSGDVMRPEPPAGSVVGRNLTVVAPYEQQASPRLERGHEDVPAETKHPCLAHRGEARAENPRGLAS